MECCSLASAHTPWYTHPCSVHTLATCVLKCELHECGCTSDAVCMHCVVTESKLVTTHTYAHTRTHTHTLRHQQGMGPHIRPCAPCSLLCTREYPETQTPRHSKPSAPTMTVCVCIVLLLCCSSASQDSGGQDMVQAVSARAQILSPMHTHIHTQNT